MSGLCPALLWLAGLVVEPPAVVPEAPAIRDLARVIENFSRSPSLGEVQSAALQRARLGTRMQRTLIRRIRSAAILPELQAGYDHSIDGGWKIGEATDEGDTLATDAGYGNVVRARVTWQLDRLIFNSDELRGLRTELDLVDQRERLLTMVTGLYFERLRLRLEQHHAPPDGLSTLEVIERSVRLREVEGLLSGLTGLVLNAP